MTAILTTPIADAVAWNGAQMIKSDAWLYRFPERSVEEIDSALRRVKARGLAFHEVAKADFPLPTLAADLANIAHELEHGRGFVQMKGLPVDRYDAQDAEIVFWGLGTYLGSALSQNAKGDLLGHVRDEGLDIANGDVRAYQTRVSQGFHTDIGGDIVGLMCLQRSKSGGASRVVSSMAIYNELLSRYPWYVGLLYKSYNVDWRGEEPQGAPPVYREPIYAYYDGRLSCRFTPRYIRSAQARTGEKLSAVEEEVITIIERLAEELSFEVEFDPGDVQLINNYVIMHGRAGYEDFDADPYKRHLLRLWLNVGGARALPAEFKGGRARLGVPARHRSATPFQT